MNLGEIYVWTTDRATGHAQRRKYHVYIAEAGWRDPGQAFLFISSANYTGYDFCLSPEDYAFLLTDSFVSCSGIVVYPDDTLAATNPVLVGRMSRSHLAALRNAVAASEAMEEWQIQMVCSALAATL